MHIRAPFHFCTGFLLCLKRTNVFHMRTLKSRSEVLTNLNWHVSGWPWIGGKDFNWAPVLSFSFQFEEMNSELEENKELAENRLSELDKLRQDLEEVTTQNEKLKVRLGWRIS